MLAQKPTVKEKKQLAFDVSTLPALVALRFANAGINVTIKDENHYILDFTDAADPMFKQAGITRVFLNVTVKKNAMVVDKITFAIHSQTITVNFGDKVEDPLLRRISGYLFKMFRYTFNAFIAVNFFKSRNFLNQSINHYLSKMDYVGDFHDTGTFSVQYRNLKTDKTHTRALRGCFVYILKVAVDLQQPNEHLQTVRFFSEEDDKIDWSSANVVTVQVLGSIAAVKEDVSQKTEVGA